MLLPSHDPSAPRAPGASPPLPTVSVIDPVGTLRFRLRQLVGPQAPFQLVGHDVGDRASGAVAVDAVDAVVVHLGAEPAIGMEHVRAARRTFPHARVVAVGDGTEGFEEAFEHGVDTWVDLRADDATLIIALTGHLQRRGARARSRRRPPWAAWSRR